MLAHSINRFFQNVSLLFLIVILSACNGASETSATDPAVEYSAIPLSIDFSNDDNVILQAVYFDIRTPVGFYSEYYADSDTYYSTSNIKNVELLPIANRIGVARYELSTDDFTEALDWSEQAANYMPAYKQLVDNSETDLYFEFLRVDLNNPLFVHRSRVFKKSALDRSGIDLNQPDNYQGQINTQTLSAERVKMLIEYFWTYSFSNNRGNAVLTSNTIETDVSYIHVMEEAKLTTGLVDQCDTVEIFESTYTVQKDTGDIWREQVTTREISSKRYGSNFEICNNG